MSLSKLITTASAHVAQVIELRLFSQQLDLMRANGRFEAIKQERRLSLDGCDLPGDAFAAAFTADALPLTALSLSGNPISDAGLVALAAADRLRHLHTLRLDAAHLSRRGVSAIEHATWRATLSTLSLANNNLRADGAAALSACLATLPSLATLDLQSNALGSDGLTALLLPAAGTPPALPSLRTLCLRFNGLGDAAARALCAPSLSTLTHLDLATNNLSDDALITLAASAPWLHLRDLNLNDNQVTDDGLRALLHAPTAASLTDLHLAGNALTSASLLALSAPNVLPRLRLLDIRRNDISMEAIASFCDQAPHCQVLWR